MKKYESEEIVINWEPEKCTHSTNCWKQLVSVFNPKNRPWVNVEGADDDRIVAQIDRCPSGALSYEWKDGRKVEAKPVSEEKVLQPDLVDLEADKKYAWCSCNRSSDQPFCNGSHAGTEKKPMVFSIKEGKKVALCRCKATKNPPFCDGTHASLA